MTNWDRAINMAVLKETRPEIHIEDGWGMLAASIIMQNVLDEVYIWRNPPDRHILWAYRCKNIYDYIELMRMPEWQYEMIAAGIGLNISYNELVDIMMWKYKDRRVTQALMGSSWMDHYSDDKLRRMRNNVT